ncbi:hypothetical protein BV22DRAFT_785661 [Leucogyrophana mollusca]|uniref:Uncharacterized protein n=1 Tax=Leucogyrophana mollusca TaxID=85980 RepID=A0ACB8B5Z1_9AGAM|nr:hypothetical protein BV22DRAFT_785661 [Leucogyrophana mollusca]
MELKSSLPPLYHDLSQHDLDNSLAENAKIFTSDTDHESPLVSHPQTCRPSNHSSVFPSTAQIRVLCYSLHGVLLAIHIVLLGLWTHHVEHQVVMPIGPFSNSLSVGLTVALQAFFTMFQAALVVSTQQLALRRNLLRYQTLTATHDQSNAWTGFGAALMSLWSQTRLSAATFGVSSVALYLLSISVLHVSSSSLINVETFNATYPTTVATVLGMPSDMESIFTSDYDWYDATAVASMVGQLTELTTVGVTNATLYDTLSNTAGIGLASVTSTTLLATCRSLPNITVSGSEPNTYSDSTALYNITAAGGYSTITLTDADALLANALKYYGWIDGPSEQIGQLVFCITPPILDAQGNSGSTFSFQRQIISKDGEPVGNETVVVQAMGCSISYANETGTVDVRTNQLLQPSIPPAQPAIWETLQWPVVDEVDDITGFLSAGFNHAAFSLEQWAPMGTPLGYSNLLEYRLMSLLGLQTEGSVFNQSTVSSPPITLNEFQSALAEVTAAIVWTGARMNTTPAFLGQEFQLSTGETEVTMSAVKARLNINILPVVVGFGASTILFGLAILMIRGPDGDRGTDDPAVDSTGVLQVLWLASRHSVACEQVARVASPSNNKLRKAGMFKISFSRISSSTDQSPLRISRQNFVQMGSVNSRGDPSEHSPLTPNRLAPYDQSRGGRQATDMFLEMDELEHRRLLQMRPRCHRFFRGFATPRTDYLLPYTLFFSRSGVIGLNTRSVCR